MHAWSIVTLSRTERAFEKRGTHFPLGRTDFPFQPIHSSWLFLAFKFQFTAILWVVFYAEIAPVLLLCKLQFLESVPVNFFKKNLTNFIEKSINTLT